MALMARGQWAAGVLAGQVELALLVSAAAGALPGGLSFLAAILLPKATRIA